MPVRLKKLVYFATRAILLTVLIFINSGLYSQDISLFMTDVIKPETREIDLAKTSIESTQVMFNLNKDLDKSRLKYATELAARNEIHQ